MREKLNPLIDLNRSLNSSDYQDLPKRFHKPFKLERKRLSIIGNAASAVHAEHSPSGGDTGDQRERSTKRVSSLLSLCIKRQFAENLERELRGGKGSFGQIWWERTEFLIA